MREIGIGVLGLGNVGSGVIRLLGENQSAIESRIGARLVVKRACVRDLDKKRSVSASVLTTDVFEVIDDPSVEIVCELIGGIEDAGQAVRRALTAGKHVVSANKALIATCGRELTELAAKHRVDLAYEAAVCGGVPVIRSLREGLASDRIDSVVGIVNGTSNFITTAMASGEAGFADTLKEAQRLGYAEADPTLDVSGMDAAHKLAILAFLSFGVHIDPRDIHVEGIDQLDAYDYRMAREFGYVVKPLAMARNHEEGVEARVHPALIPHSWLLADVPGSKNAVYVQSYALGGSMYYGAGAGMMPTAMSVVSDVIDVCRNMQASATGLIPLQLVSTRREASVRPMGDILGRYYLRFAVDDRPGVLGRITTVLGDSGVSIAELVQTQKPDEHGFISIALLTHEAREADVQRALTVCLQQTEIAHRAVLLRVVSS